MTLEDCRSRVILNEEMKNHYLQIYHWMDIGGDHKRRRRKKRIIPLSGIIYYSKVQRIAFTYDLVLITKLKIELEKVFGRLERKAKMFGIKYL